MLKLDILLIVVVGNNRKSVLDLESEGVGGIIDYDNVLHISIHQNSEVLDVDSLFRLDAVFSEEAVLDILVFWVKVVEDYIGVAGVGGRENYNLVVLRQFLEALQTVGSHIDSCLKKSKER